MLCSTWNEGELKPARDKGSKAKRQEEKAGRKEEEPRENRPLGGAGRGRERERCVGKRRQVAEQTSTEGTAEMGLIATRGRKKTKEKSKTPQTQKRINTEVDSTGVGVNS